MNIDSSIPVYPEGILPDNNEYDPPKYDGDETNVDERVRVKLYNLWTVWSDLRKNEELMKKLAITKCPKPELYLKNVLVQTIDRMGKMLADGNIVEELQPTQEKTQEK